MHPPPTLSVYGKLPLSKEFLRFRCGGGAAGQLYQWINGGFDHVIRTRRDAGGVIGVPRRILFYADGMSDLVVATIRESADNEGLRQFPFACYAAVPREQFPGALDEQLGMCEPLWQQLHEVDVALSAEPDLDGFKAAFRQMELEGVEPVSRSTLSEIPMAPIVQSIAAVAPGGIPGKIFGSALYDVARAVRILDSRTIPGGRLPALRLPVARTASTVAQSRAWLGCLRDAGFLAARSTPISLILPIEGEGAGDVWLQIRPMRAADFGVFTTTTKGQFFPDPGGAIARVEEEPYPAFTARVEAAFLRPDSTLADLSEFRLV